MSRSKSGAGGVIAPRPEGQHPNRNGGWRHRIRAAARSRLGFLRQHDRIALVSISASLVLATPIQTVIFPDGSAFAISAVADLVIEFGSTPARPLVARAVVGAISM